MSIGKNLWICVICHWGNVFFQSGSIVKFLRWKSHPKEVILLWGGGNFVQKRLKNKRTGLNGIKMGSYIV